ncbi:pupal cuticle protein G1A [Drosophila obscura]|uniref:pupal cuticle protein G1A n=1 Tax=Drosophila obscura TaxID=7282 RepID=UPI000BA11CF1|nr:pupal cuticle protein G1A [Drosophila obscura]
MFKYVAFFALLAVAAAAPGLIAETHSFVQPALLTKTAYVDHSASSAITHQSNVNLVRKVPVAPVVTYAAAPVVHQTVVPAAPLVKTIVQAPQVHTVHAAPLIKTVVPAAPLVHTVHSAPLVHTVHAAPLVKTVVPAAPLLHTVVAGSPVVYSAYHK